MAKTPKGACKLIHLQDYKSTYRFYFLLILFAGMEMINWVSAQDTSRVMNLYELVVTGQYEVNSLSKSVMKVKVIDARRLEAQGAFNLQQVLGNELNIRIQQDPILGSSLQLQGVGGNNIKILIDGIPVVGRENGNIDLNQINLNTIDHIEYVEGPMSVSYGTDALGGVINLITRKQKASTRNLKLSSYAESVGQYNMDMSAGMGGEKFGLSGSLGRNFFSGYSPVAGTRTKLWKPRTQYSGDLSLQRFHKGGSMRFTQQVFQELVTDRGEPTVDWSQAVALDRYYTTLRLGSAFFYDRKFDGKRAVNLVASYNFYKRSLNTYRKDLVQLTQELVPTQTDQDTTTFQQAMSRGTYANVAFSNRMSYQLGYEMNHEFSSGARIGGELKELGEYSLFLSTELKPTARLVLRPALRTTYHTRYAAPLVPSVHLKYDFGDQLQFRASYARGFRAPSIKELFLEFVDVSHNLKGNPQLQAEVSNNFIAGFTWDYRRDERVFRLDPGVFYNRIYNMIDLVRTGNGTGLYYQYMNVNAFTSTGATVNAEYRTRKYQVSLGYALTGRKSELPGNPVADRFYWTPEGRLNASWNLLKYDASLNLFCKWNGKLQQYQYSYLNDQVSLNDMDPFALVDCSLGKTFFEKKLSLTLGVKNILHIVNVNASLFSNPHAGAGSNAAVAMGRNGFAGLRYQF